MGPKKDCNNRKNQDIIQKISKNETFGTIFKCK